MICSGENWNDDKLVNVSRKYYGSQQQKKRKDGRLCPGRDYVTGSPVQIEIFEDKAVEILEK